MCYFTKRVLNKRFLPNRKNRWNPPVCTDERFRYVEVECGHCFECRKKKRREWRIRNYEQLKETPVAVFFTGTVSPKRYEHICRQYGYKNDVRAAVGHVSVMKLTVKTSGKNLRK